MLCAQHPPKEFDNVERGGGEQERRSVEPGRDFLVFCLLLLIVTVSAVQQYNPWLLVTHRPEHSAPPSVRCLKLSYSSLLFPLTPNPVKVLDWWAGGISLDRCVESLLAGLAAGVTV